jgi:nucleoside phosphorylase
MSKIGSNLLRAVIFTAIPVEYQAVRAHLINVHELIHPEGTVYESGNFIYNGQQWDVSIAETRAGSTHATLEVERAINYFKPGIVLFVGVAGGVKDVKLGDVVVASKVYDYESGKASATFQPRPEVGNPTYLMVQRAQAEAKKHDWLRWLAKPIPDPSPRVFVAPIAAGGKVVASTRSAIWRLLQTNYSDALAVEMEGYGFLQAVHANQQVNALVIRGISDLIEGKGEADAANFQEIAARHAAAFAFEILAKLAGDAAFRSSLTSRSLLEKESEMPPLETRNQITFTNYGSTQGPVQLGNHTIQQNFITNTPPRDEVAEGRGLLKRGRAALLNGDYSSAKQHLDEAARLLREDQQPEESSEVKFLQALVLLKGQRPFTVTLSIFRLVEQLFGAAINLHPSYSYIYTLALLKRDFERNGFPRMRQEAHELKHQASLMFQTSKDVENMELLSHCQRSLINASQQWW